MTRNKIHTLRSALHTVEFSFRGDHSPQAEQERDLISVACVDLWAGNLKKLCCRLRRLVVKSTERKEAYSKILALVTA